MLNQMLSIRGFGRRVQIALVLNFLLRIEFDIVFLERISSTDYP